MPPNAIAPLLLVGLARPRRWIVLAAAILLGYAAAGGFAGHDRSHGPADFPIAIAGFLVGTAHAQATAPAAPSVPAAPDAAAKRDGASDGTKSHGATIGVTIDDTTGRVRIAGAGTGDHEYDSFEAFVQQAPWIAGLVFAVTFLVFLTPILIVALVIWYKMRKNRMLNETLVKLAEKGVVPPAEALGAIATGRQSAALEAGPSTAPLYDQAREIRRKVVLVRPAQGHHRRRGRPGLHVLLDARRRRGQLRRPGAPLRRSRLHRAVVLRGPADRAPLRPARSPGRLIRVPYAVSR